MTAQGPETGLQVPSIPEGHVGVVRAGRKQPRVEKSIEKLNVDLSWNRWRKTRLLHQQMPVTFSHKYSRGDTKTNLQYHLWYSFEKSPCPYKP